MLGELGLRWKAALESPVVLFRRGNSSTDRSPVTESEISELEAVARALRKQNHLVDDELTSSMEACWVATDGLAMLKNELEGKRRQRDELRQLLEETKSDLAQLDKQYLDEKESREVNHHDIVRMKQNTEMMRKDAINMRAEMKQMMYFQEVVDAETKHRLRVDVQNLELERERESIKLRKLNNERDKLRSELDQLEEERDAAQRVKFKRHQELADAMTTRDMYKVRQEALELHLQEGDFRNVISSRLSSVVQSFRELWKGRAQVEESLHNFGMPCHDDWKQQYKRVNLRRRSRSPIPREVGKIVICADDGVESSDLFALVPPLFEMGHCDEFNDDRRSRKDVESPSESSSVSVISALTADDDTWAKYKTEK